MVLFIIGETNHKNPSTQPEIISDLFGKGNSTDCVRVNENGHDVCPPIVDFTWECLSS